ncbi:MAG: hypothetical protein HQK53_10125 [Oligoflexia bacterium]|nr:hypothetical protein [Oligoflexia bacterium]
MKNLIRLISITIIINLLTVFFVQADIIKEIKITGKTKTHKSAILRKLRMSEGQDLDPHDLPLVREKMLKISQVILKSISFNDGILTIEIEDKWSIFPIPMITQSGDYYTRGALIYENNFLGTLGTFAPAVGQTNSGFNGILYYQDEELFNDHIGTKILFMKRADLTKFKRREITRSIFETRYTTFTITPNYLWEKHVFKAGPIFVDKEVLSTNKQELAHKKFTALLFRHHLNDYHVYDFYQLGIITTYNLIAGMDGGKLITVHEGDVRWHKAIGDDFFDFMVYGYYVNDNSHLYPKLIGGQDGCRGYDRASTPVSQNLSLMFQYQKQLLNRTYLAPFYEWNTLRLIDPIAQIEDRKKLTENTLGLSFRYYFEKISIPALMLEYGRNIEDKSNHFNLNIGLSI